MRSGVVPRLWKHAVVCGLVLASGTSATTAASAAVKSLNLKAFVAWIMPIANFTQTTTPVPTTTLRPTTTPAPSTALPPRTARSSLAFNDDSSFLVSIIIGVSSCVFAVLLVCMAILYRRRRRQRLKLSIPPTRRFSPAANQSQCFLTPGANAADTFDRESHLVRIYPSTGSSTRVNMSTLASSFVSPEVDANEGYTTNPSWPCQDVAPSLPVRTIPPASVKPLREGSEDLLRQHASSSSSSSTIASWRPTQTTFAEHSTVRDSTEIWSQSPWNSDAFVQRPQSSS